MAKDRPPYINLRPKLWLLSLATEDSSSLGPKLGAHSLLLRGQRGSSVSETELWKGDDRPGDLPILSKVSTGLTSGIVTRHSLPPVKKMLHTGGTGFYRP
jgi:hypothetical protein